MSCCTRQIPSMDKAVRALIQFARDFDKENLFVKKRCNTCGGKKNKKVRHNHTELRAALVRFKDLMSMPTAHCTRDVVASIRHSDTYSLPRSLPSRCTAPRR